MVNRVDTVHAQARNLSSKTNIVKLNAEPARRAICLDTVPMRSIQWLEKPIWQRSAFQLLAAPKGSGKGTYLARLAAKITTGKLDCGPQNVLFVSSEDSASIDLVPRLTAAGADITRCHMVSWHVRLPDDIPDIQDIAAELGNLGALILDPVANHIGDRNSNAEAEVREAIAPLNQLADTLNSLIIGVRHIGKDRTRGAAASILGSTAWVDTPRAVVMVATDDEDDTLRHLQVVAGNRTANRGGILFRIEGVTLPSLTEQVTRATELGQSGKDLDTLLTKTPNRETSRSSQAKDLILDKLEAAPTLELESDTLDALIAAELGIAAKTVQNLRGDLRKAGLLRVYPQTNHTGQPERWIVARTGAPR